MLHCASPYASNLTMEPSVWHYTYYSYEVNGRGYIGKRTSRVPPEQDPYLGSFSDKTFKPTHKIVIATYDSAKNAYRAESALQTLFCVHKAEHFANQVIYSAGKFCPERKLTDWDNLPTEGSRRESALEVLAQDALTTQSYQDSWRTTIDLINKERRELIADGKTDEIDTIYLLKSPYGVTYPVTSLESFCRKSNIDADGIKQMFLGKTDSWKGWERGELCYPWNE